MTEYFMTSVADAYLYDGDDNLVAWSKSLADSSVEVSLSNQDVRGGKGNPKRYVYYHSPELTLTLTDVQFNLAFLSETVGSTLGTGTNVFTEEDVTLGASGAGTVTGTPIAFQGTTIYGWVTHAGVTEPERVSFTGSNFTSSVGSEDDVVCVRYYNTNAAAKNVTISSNIVPNIAYIVLDSQLAANDTGTNIVGKVEVHLPKAQLSGAFSLSMTADGVSQTPLTATALTYDPNTGGCTNGGALGYVRRVIDSANWYDDVTAIAFVGGDITLSTTLGTYQTVVKAIHSDGSTSTPPVADLTFASDTVGTATISSSGLVTGVASGTTYVRATITSKTSIDCAAEVTVP